MELLLLNPTLSAADALGLGIVNRVVPDDELIERTQEIAQTLAAQPPLALAATKRLVWGGVGATVDERLPEEARTVSELSGTADSREGLAAVIERRDGKFIGA
ncbi:MAG: enoyl-CoA hydratase [Aeromicrobium sp.]|nr:enoyl-CoA hydratase [Aeromicrobium sp.]